MRARVWAGTAAVVLGSLLAAGCGGGGKETADENAARAVSGAYPVSVTDCAGARTTFSTAPARIVTSNASGLELLGPCERLSQQPGQWRPGIRGDLVRGPSRQPVSPRAHHARGV